MTVEQAASLIVKVHDHYKKINGKESLNGIELCAHAVKNRLCSLSQFADATQVIRSYQQLKRLQEAL